MAKPAVKSKPSRGAFTVNGLHSESLGPPRPSDYEIIRKESWIAEFIQRAWPVLIVIAGGIFAAGGLWVKIDILREQHLEQRAAILAQSRVIDDVKSSLSDFRLEWAVEQAKERKILDDLSLKPIPDERPKILASPKKRAFHKPSGFFN